MGGTLTRGANRVSRSEINWIRTVNPCDGHANGSAACCTHGHESREEWMVEGWGGRWGRGVSLLLERMCGRQKPSGLGAPAFAVNTWDHRACLAFVITSFQIRVEPSPWAVWRADMCLPHTGVAYLSRKYKRVMPSWPRHFHFLCSVIAHCVRQYSRSFVDRIFWEQTNWVTKAYRYPLWTNTTIDSFQNIWNNKYLFKPWMVLNSQILRRI